MRRKGEEKRERDDEDVEKGNRKGDTKLGYRSISQDCMLCIAINLLMYWPLSPPDGC